MERYTCAYCDEEFNWEYMHDEYTCMDCEAVFERDERIRELEERDALKYEEGD